MSGGLAAHSCSPVRRTGQSTSARIPWIQCDCMFMEIDDVVVGGRSRRRFRGQCLLNWSWSRSRAYVTCLKCLFSIFTLFGQAFADIAVVAGAGFGEFLAPEVPRDWHLHLKSRPTAPPVGGPSPEREFRACGCYPWSSEGLAPCCQSQDRAAREQHDLYLHVGSSIYVIIVSTIEPFWI